MYSSSGDMDIGVTLRKARQDIGVTLDDVEYETKIRKRYLEALEREDYGNLPSAVYSRGFLKTYANYLGLDGGCLSRELQSRWDSLQEREREEAASRKGRPDRPTEDRRSRDASEVVSVRHTRPPGYRRISSLAILSLVFALVFVAAAFSGLYWVGQNSKVAQEVPKSPEVSSDRSNQSEQPLEDGRQSSVTGTTIESGSSTNNDEAASSSSVAGVDRTETDEGQTDAVTDTTKDSVLSSEMVRVTVKVERVPTWLNVQTDDDLILEQVAQPGFTQTFEARSRVSIWTGNAGAVRLEVNGQDYGAIGEPGQVERKTFTLKPAQG